MSQAEKLKPCPFCGGENVKTVHVRDGRKVACHCGACGSPEYHGPAGLPTADERAIKEWNRRSTASLSHTMGVKGEPCHCTKIEQDETCPVGYPSLLCDDCDGKGIRSALTPTQQLVAWIPWTGGDFMPVTGETSVWIQSRSGNIEGPALAREWAGEDSCWKHTGGGGDIIAYSTSDPALAQPQAVPGWEITEARIDAAFEVLWPQQDWDRSHCRAVAEKALLAALNAEVSKS